MAFVAALALLAVAPSSPAQPDRSGAAETPAQDLTIEHKGVGCVVAGRFPKLDACLQPASHVARARIYFRGDLGSNWYYVEMKREGTCHAALLPRPTQRLSQIQYYIEVVDTGFASHRSDVFAASVMADASACSTPSVEKAAVEVGAVAGAAAIPSGFAVAGAAGLSAGTIAAVVVGGGAAVVGGIAIVGGQGPRETSTTTLPTPGGPSTRPSPAPSPTPTPGPSPTTTTTPGPTTTSTTTTLLPPLPTTLPATLPPTTLPPTTLPPTTLPPTTVPLTTLKFSASIREGAQPAAASPASRTARGGAAEPARPAEGGVLAWTSELDVPGGAGQVILNGMSLFFTGTGRAEGSGRAFRGPNSLEAQLVRGDGRPGLWRFELTGAFQPGSLRVVAGEPVLVTAQAVVLRLAGRPGERVVLAFRSGPPR